MNSVNVYEGYQTVNGEQVIHPKLKALNTSQIPAITHKDKVLTRYHPIIQYMSKQFRGGLYPEDDYQKGNITHMEDFALNGFPDSFYSLLMR